MPVAATVFLSESNGAGEVVTDNISNLNFGGVDMPNLVPANHPIVRPAFPTSRWSFEKFVRLKVQSMGDSLLIQNPKFWKSSGVYLAGEGLFNSNSATLAYSAPAQAQGSKGIATPTSEPSQNIPIAGAMSGGIVAAPTYTSGYTAIGPIINNGAETPIGPLNQKTFIFQWDES